MARNVKLSRGNGAINVVKDRYMPITAEKGWFGYKNQQTHFNSPQLLIDSSAILVSTYLLKELAPSAKFLFNAGRNVVALTIGGAISAIQNMQTAIAQSNNNQQNTAQLQAQINQLQALLAQAQQQQQQTATP